ncbi:MAG: ATP-binding protein [Alphaproteobacteria bacterium]
MVIGLYFWACVAGAFSALLVSAVCAVVRARTKRGFRAYVAALEQASDFTGNGLMFFDENERLRHANSRVYDFLPDIDRLKNGGVISLHDTLDYFYDHGVDCDQSLLNTLGRSAEKLSSIGFREVINASGGRLCLVEAQKIPGVGTNVILIDVGESKNREELMLRLNRYNHELSQAIEAATSGIVIIRPDAEGQKYGITFANKAFCNIFQSGREEIAGRDMVDVFGCIEDPDALEKIKEIGRMQGGGDVELCLRHPVEGERWYDLQLTPLKDENGKLELFVGILNDTTELKIQAAESSKAQKLEALGQLSAGVAHDFNNVLSIIDGYARIVSRDMENREKALENLERIRTAAQRGTSLIKQMLTFSRHEIVHSGAVDLGEMVREQEGLLRPLLDASIQCVVRVGDGAMWVECSPEKITQILMNLAVNARDAMERGGRLLIECGVCPEEALPEILQRKEGGKGACAFLKVEDTGTGMEKEVLERIFDPFFTTKEQGKGTGLGLSMVYGLVKQAGGVIDVESVLGEGTSITVYLPLTDKPPKCLSGSAEVPGSIRFDGYTALVAEDEPDLLLLVSSALEELGMAVLSACDGREALVLQDEYEGVIDLLLTDVVMPELNGVDLADFVQEFRPETHVIFMSGYPDKGQAARVSIPENAVFAAKPIRHDDLAGLVYSKLKGDSGDGGPDYRAPRWASKQDDDNEKELAQ